MINCANAIEVALENSTVSLTVSLPAPEFRSDFRYSRKSIAPHSALPRPLLPPLPPSLNNIPHLAATMARLCAVRYNVARRQPVNYPTSQLPRIVTRIDPPSSFVTDGDHRGPPPSKRGMESKLARSPRSPALGATGTKTRSQGGDAPRRVFLSAFSRLRVVDPRRETPAMFDRFDPPAAALLRGTAFEKERGTRVPRECHARRVCPGGSKTGRSNKRKEKKKKRTRVEFSEGAGPRASHATTQDRKGFKRPTGRVSRTYRSRAHVHRLSRCVYR